jgi:hypothetical protein
MQSSSVGNVPRDPMQKVAATSILALLALLTSYATIHDWPDGQTIATHISPANS